jgi:hypothetical protein
MPNTRGDGHLDAAKLLVAKNLMKLIFGRYLKRHTLMIYG